MKKERILIFGNGQIGNFYFNFFNGQGLVSKISRADITCVGQIKRAINSFNPTVVINAAAKTNLEWCGTHRLEAFRINVLGTDNIASICAEKGIYFIHFSSGCIFQSRNKNDAKSEDSAPNPAAYYSWTKVWSENIISLNKNPNFKYLILRPRQLISTQLSHKNMLVKMLTFSYFIDKPNTLTVIDDLMNWTLIAIRRRETGVLHVANEGTTTPYRIGMLLKKHILPQMEIRKISKEDLSRKLPNERVDAILNVDRLKSMTEVKSCDQRLEEVIIQLGKNIKAVSKRNLKRVLEMTVSQSKQRTTPNKTWRMLID